MRQHALHSFFAAVRLCAKTAIVFGLGSLFLLLSGCAGNTWPSVERLKDGRQGFVIREKAGMDAASLAEFQRAVALLNDGKDGEAIELMKRVIDRSPRFSAPHIDIALAYLRIGAPEPAEQHMKAALSLVPGHPVAGNEYGLLLRKTGRFNEAREVYEKAVDRFPDYLPARKNLGILCDLYLNDPKCALEQFERYSRLMPEDEKVKIWIAELRIRLGR
jgi:Tfp pilus assembly protein PilF